MEHGEWGSAYHLIRLVKLHLYTPERGLALLCYICEAYALQSA